MCALGAALAFESSEKSESESTLVPYSENILAYLFKRISYFCFQWYLSHGKKLMLSVQPKKMLSITAEVDSALVKMSDIT